MSAANASFLEFRSSISDMWKKKQDKNGKGFQLIRVDKKQRKKPDLFRMNYGRGGGLGAGCGVGIGAGFIGGIGMGASTWNHLKFVLGIGAGCGVGIGYGFGLGYGLLWDRPPPEMDDANRIVIRITSGN